MERRIPLSEADITRLQALAASRIPAAIPTASSVQKPLSFETTPPSRADAKDAPPFASRNKHTKAIGAVAVVVFSAGVATTVYGDIPYRLAKAKESVTGAPFDAAIFRDPDCSNPVIEIGYAAQGSYAQKMRIITDPEQRAAQLANSGYKPTAISEGFFDTMSRDNLPLLPETLFPKKDDTSKTHRLPAVVYGGDIVNNKSQPAKLALAMCFDPEPGQKIVSEGDNAGSVKIDASHVNFVILPSTVDKGSQINIGYEKYPYNLILKSPELRKQFPTGELERQQEVIKPKSSDNNPAILNKIKLEALAPLDNPNEECGRLFNKLADKAVRSYLSSITGKDLTPRYDGSFVGPSQSTKKAMNSLPENERATGEIKIKDWSTTCQANKTTE